MIGQVLKRGRSVRGLLYYLFTEGQAGLKGLEAAHADARVIAGWDPADSLTALQPPVCAGGRRDFAALASALNQPVVALGLDREQARKLKPVYHLAISAAKDPQTGQLVDRYLDDTREALAALGQIPLLKALAVGQFLAALSAGATSALLVVLAQDRLGGGEGYGLLVGSIGAGAALGPLLLLRKIKDPRRPLFVFGPYAVRGLVDLILAVVTAVPLAAAALIVYGLSTSTGSVTFSSLVQSRVPEELRGRAFAGFDVLWQSGRMLSLLGGGLLADAVGIQAVYLLGGLLLLAAAAVGAVAAAQSKPAGSPASR